ncbi:MAG TPA: acyltransferase [Gemmatimonadaceae bacterium]
MTAERASAIGQASRPYTPSTAPSSERIPVLDGVRGLAILLVLVNNAYPEVPVSPGLDTIARNISDFGWPGVDLFFVLSGFLITGILCDTKGGEGYFGRFYARRVVRIFPLYYAALLIFLVVLPGLGFADAFQLHQLRLERWYYWSYLANVGLALHGNTRFETMQFWSLAVEEQFYLLWPLIVLLFERRRLIALCIVAMCASLALRFAWRWAGLSDEWVYLLLPFRIDSLAVGAMIALALRGPGGLDQLARAARPVWRWMAPVGFGLVALYELTRDDRASIALQVVGYPAIALAFGALLVRTLAAPSDARLARFFGSGAMRFFGRYSYGMYVLYGVVLVLLRHWVWWVREVPPVLGSRIPTGLAILFLTTALTIPTALLSWHLLEKRFLALKRLFPYDRARESGIGNRESIG